MELRHRDRYLDHLAGVPMFAELDRDDLALVARNSTEINFAEGEVLMNEGDPAAEFFVILEGQAKVMRDGQEVATLGPGDFAGELALLQHRARNATVTATTPMTALVLNRREFSSLLDQLPGFERKILRAMATRLAVVDRDTIH